MAEKITVIGCGRWGSFIAWYLNTLGIRVTLYGRKSSENMRRLIESRKNEIITLPEEITLSTDLKAAEKSDIIVISVATQGLRSLMEELKNLDLKNKTFVLCMKGIEIGTLKRLTEIVREYADETCGIAVWIGPGHVEEFTKGIPNCMVIDSENEEVKERLVSLFQGPLIRFYYGTDLIGNEVGAAAKNVIGIAAGFLDGLGLSSLKGALMSRGTREISELISAMGGNELSAYGLCHLGDYEATVFSRLSHNREFGEKFVRGEEYNKLAEGYFTVKALVSLGEKHSVDLPICRAVYNVLYENYSVADEIDSLFKRQLRNEF
jgi:glycerol-3-phosphate dehydrogenase (NAD(P)+)